MAAVTQQAPGGARVQIQRFGTFLSNMVLPNIGAFIAWGLITALFIKTGWIALIGEQFGYSTDATATASSASSGTGAGRARASSAR